MAVPPHEAALSQMQKQVDTLHQRVRQNEDIPKGLRGRMGSAFGLLKGYFKSLARTHQEAIQSARNEEKQKAQETITGIHAAYRDEIDKIKSNLARQHQGALQSKNVAIEKTQNQLEAEVAKRKALEQALEEQQEYSKRIEKAMQEKDDLIRGHEKISEDRFTDLTDEQRKNKKLVQNLEQERQAHEQTRQAHAEAQTNLRQERTEHNQTRKEQAQSQSQLQDAQTRVNQLEEQVRQGVQPDLEAHAAAEIRHRYGIVNFSNLQVPVFGRRMVRATSARDVWAAIRTRTMSGERSHLSDILQLPKGNDVEVLAALAHTAGVAPIFNIGNGPVHVDELNSQEAQGLRQLLQHDIANNVPLNQSRIFTQTIHPDEISPKPATSRWKKWGAWAAAGTAAAASVGLGGLFFKAKTGNVPQPKPDVDIVKSISDINDADLYQIAGQVVKPGGPDAGVHTQSAVAALLRLKLDHLKEKYAQDPSRIRQVDLRKMAEGLHEQFVAARDQALDQGQIEYKTVRGKPGPQADTEKTLHQAIYPGLNITGKDVYTVDRAYYRHAKTQFKTYPGFGTRRR